MDSNYGWKVVAMLPGHIRRTEWFVDKIARDSWIAEVKDMGGRIISAQREPMPHEDMDHL